MSQISNNMYHELVNVSWWRWFFGQNAGQNFKNNDFLEEETFKLVWEIAATLASMNDMCDMLAWVSYLRGWCTSLGSVGGVLAQEAG